MFLQSDESNEVLAKFRVHAHVGSKVDGALVWNKKGTGNLTLRKAKAAGSKPFVVFGLDNVSGCLLARGLTRGGRLLPAVTAWHVGHNA